MIDPKNDYRDLYFPQLNMLRGIAALMVVIYHFTNHWDSVKGHFLAENDPARMVGYYGHLGVFVFFVISGFVIPLSLYKGRYHVGSFFRFMAKRLVRLEPPYIASIALVLALSLYYFITKDKEWDFGWGRTAAHFFYLIPFTDYEWYDPLYWTLALEFQFYIIMALIFPWLDHRLPAVRWITLAAFCVGALFFFDERFAIHYSSLFALGIVCFWRVTGRAGDKEFYIGVLALLVWAFFRFDALIVASMLLATVFIFHVRFHKPWSDRFGDISYSLYLTHNTIGGHAIALAAIGVENTWLKYAVILGSIVGVLLFSYWFWRIAEGPALRASRRIRLS